MFLGGEMVTAQVKPLATNPEVQSSFPETHLLYGETQSSDLQIIILWHACTHMHTKIIIKSF